MIFLMVVIGGITRLTLSGLSITEWQPVTGIVPPLSEAAWPAEFEKYQQIPQYKLLNAGMTLGEFKSIFLWEYMHRLWGRLIGFVYALPLMYFLIRRQVPRRLVLPLSGIFLLGFAQGALGWYMVKSGLADRVVGQPVPPRRASRAGAGDLCADLVDRARDIGTRRSPHPDPPPQAGEGRRERLGLSRLRGVAAGAAPRR